MTESFDKMIKSLILKSWINTRWKCYFDILHQGVIGKLMELEKITLSEATQIQKAKCHMFFLICAI